MAPSWSRRAFLAALPVMTRAQVIASEQRKYRDPATEFELTRLTDPSLSSCFLPAPPRRAINQGNNSLLYCSDRSGKLQAYRMDLKTGESRQLTNASALDPSTVSMLRDDRNICFCDGQSIQVAGARDRTIYSPDEGWVRAEAFVVADDGNHAVVSERKNDLYRLRLVTLAQRSATTIAESNLPVGMLATRPKRAGVLYRREDGLYLVGYDGAQNRKLRTGQGTIGPALWSADGRSVYYMHQPPTSRTQELRQCIPDSNEDKFVAPTSQFVAFTRNSDASVFVGVSGSKGSPYILLLLRQARRELAVAEHRASDASAVAVQFSPNSQRLYYQTDREGKPAIYSMALERFVEMTDVSNAAYWTQPVTGRDAPAAD